MIRVRTPLLGTLALAALAACADSPSDAVVNTPVGTPTVRAGEDRVVPGEVLVGWRDGTDGARLSRAIGARGVRDGYQGRFHILTVEEGQEAATAERLRQDPNVEWAEPNYIRQPHTIDGRLWAFYNPGGMNMSFYNDPNGNTGPIPASYASIADADEDAINNIGAGGAPVIIASLDTGVDPNHPEFSGRLIAGCDWYSQVASGNSSRTCTDFTPWDTPDEGHGTHTTGTMAGSTVGVAGVTGAASNVRVLVERVCGTGGCYTSAIVNAIYHAADNGAVAMNLSLGGRTESTAEKNAIKYAVVTKGALVIASAGNSGSGKVACPACDPNAISVAATNWRDERASYSQYGSGLDISAPGGLCYSNTTEEGCIFSAIVAGYQGGRTYSGPLAGGSYAYMNGTSMAAPQVTGAAAVVASKTGLRGTNLRNRLQNTADDKGAAGYDTQFGYGRLNVYRAITNTVLAAPQ